MSELQIYLRIDNLILAHSWSNNNNQLLSKGQRICLTQERAALMECLEIYHEGIKPKYVIPEHLEIIVQQILKIIKDTNWSIPKYIIEPY